MSTAVRGDDDLAIDESAADPADSGNTPVRRRFWRMRWVFTRRLCFGGLAGGLVFFCLSMTPSLLPRASLMQGVVSGVAVAIGYGFGSLLSSILRKLDVNDRTQAAVYALRHGWIRLQDTKYDR